MKFHLVKPETSGDYQDYFNLRWKVLRQEWGQPKESAKDDADLKSYHIMARLPTGVPIGVGRIHRATNAYWQIRYMAILPKFQKMGVGVKILTQLENIALNKGATEIRLHARAQALGFYLKYHYTQLGESHVLFNLIQHYEMRKLLINI